MNEWTPLAESVERASVESIYRAAPSSVRQRLGLEVLEVGTALVSVAAGDPSTLLNRALGLGFDEPATELSVREIVAAYRKRGIDRYYVHVHPEARPAELREWVVAAGHERGRGWMKFQRDLDPPPPAHSDLSVERIGPKQAPAFGEIVAQGFGMRSASAELLAAIVGQPDWFSYLVFIDGAAAGAAAMFVHDDAAYFGWAATRRAFRGRGVQTALLRQRVVDALELEVQVMFTETGEAVAGDPQHSYSNIERAGFEAVYLRDNFVPRHVVRG